MAAHLANGLHSLITLNLLLLMPEQLHPLIDLLQIDNLLFLRPRLHQDSCHKIYKSSEEQKKKSTHAAKSSYHTA